MSWLVLSFLVYVTLTTRFLLFQRVTMVTMVLTVQCGAATVKTIRSVTESLVGVMPAAHLAFAA